MKELHEKYLNHAIAFCKSFAISFEVLESYVMNTQEEDLFDDRNEGSNLVNVPVPFTATNIVNQRVFPSNLLRCALFCVLQKGNRPYVEDYELPCLIENYKIRFTGKRLDQADYDVYQAIVEIWRANQKPRYIAFSTYHLLNLIEKHEEGTNVKRLGESILRLKRAEVSISHNGSIYWGNLVKDAFYNQDERKWLLEINPRLTKLFEYHNTKIDITIRSKLSGDFSKQLFNFYSSHEGDQNHSFDLLRNLFESSVDDKIFCQYLRKGLAQLQSEGVILKGSVDTKNKKIFVSCPKRAKVVSDAQSEPVITTKAFDSKKNKGYGGGGKVAL